MTIATTLGALVEAEAALTPICALKLSAKSAYHLAKLARLVAQETAHFHEARNGYIKELGSARPDGSTGIAQDSPAMPVFVAKVTELLAVPIEVPWGPITLDLLGEEKVTAAELAGLGPLLADPSV